MKNKNTNIDTSTLEIYVHIPFCVRKCLYCDFLSFPCSGTKTQDYLKALCREIRQTGDFVKEYGAGECRSVRSIFIGGGTPSLLDGGQVKEILDAIRQSFTLLEEVEITMESNPGTLDRTRLEEYARYGVNRLSMGLQTPDDHLLLKLGRIHTYRDFLYNYDQAREAGFKNINVDLMSGIPGQNEADYVKGLKKVAALKPDHISSYSLILEEGTPFYDDPRIRNDLPDEETDRRMYHATKEILKENGYDRYEISNYALDGKECIHNLGYWTGIPYLGFGLGASSYYISTGRWERFSNVRGLDTYLEEPFLPFDRRRDYELLSEKDRMEEYMFLGLRRMKGVDVESFEKIAGIRMADLYGNVIDRYQKMGLLKMEEGRLSLTDQGIDVSDGIFVDFMLED